MASGVLRNGRLGRMCRRSEDEKATHVMLESLIIF